ncbi:PAS domain-containing sensor histidine kinase [Agaribacterium sp. ZY112]|uniref:sensor histidine kinase n=1 Tax=Agaribacterium sp. ZY112 TaxID=3233574 RepID=UPI0035241DEA
MLKNNIRPIIALVVLMSLHATVLTFLLVSMRAESLSEKIISVLLVSLVFILLAGFQLYRFVYSRTYILKRGLNNFKDGDFSERIKDPFNDGLSSLIRAYNETADALHDERISLNQRELLLDAIIQRASLIIVLSDERGRVVHENIEARKLLYQGRSMKNVDFVSILKQNADPIAQTVLNASNAIVEWDKNDTRCTYHISRSVFNINQREHTLYLFKDLTEEIGREEVKTWKKMIRVMTHELNNSLAPISSLAHSGEKSLSMGDYSSLPLIFETISSRTARLNSFLQGYSDFAKLPLPLLAAVDVADFLNSIAVQAGIKVNHHNKSQNVRFDPIQMEQVLLNLIKNAKESGSQEGEIILCSYIYSDALVFRVQDRGTGMSDRVLENSLLPFYSTKSDGTGIGLALCQEIVQAHRGWLSLKNRSSGGLSVQIKLPLDL